jgi:bifunctional UDP-N-acetylglucosamine pyrophosphorylase/glucosamine-1-phosphate N-acetyltransferase
LTDVPAILRSEGEDVSVFQHADAREVSGINTRLELSEFERLVRVRTLRRLMLDGGVTVIDPQHTYVDPDAQIGRDTVLHPGVQIEGHTVIGESCEIRAGARITNSRVGSGVQIKDHSVVVDSEVADNCSVGPFAHLRMGTVLEEKSAVGNFVEVKKSRIGRKTKAMHLSYLGDATVGDETNIGAGTVTCNYDGKNKTPDRGREQREDRLGHDARRARPRRRAQHDGGRLGRHEGRPPRHARRRRAARVKKNLWDDDARQGNPPQDKERAGETSAGKNPAAKSQAGDSPATTDLEQNSGDTPGRALTRQQLILHSQEVKKLCVESSAMSATSKSCPSSSRGCASSNTGVTTRRASRS